MSTTMKRTIPLAITFLIVIVMNAAYFLNLGPVGATLDKSLLAFTTIILSAALGLGIINLTILHIKRIAKKEEGLWMFSVALLAALLFMVAVGLLYGANSFEFSVLFDASVAPLNATLMSMFIVWMAPAFVRMIRIKNVASFLLFATMVLTIIGGSPIGNILWPGFTDIGSWLNTVPNMAAQRGLKITIALGLIVMAVRIILGKERSYLRSEVTG